MNKEAKTLLKQNNAREKEIFKENDEVYTNMVVYLRGADITEYHQEVVREDLIQMILDGQNRGDNIQKVMGENYKEICDEIIDAMPKKTKRQKAMDILEMSLSVIWILGFISVAKMGISLWMHGANHWTYALSVGDLLSWATIIVVANVLVNHVCKTAFAEKKENKIVSYLTTWGICFVVLLLIVGCPLFFDQAFLQIPMVTAGGIYAAVFVVERVVSARK